MSMPLLDDSASELLDSATELLDTSDELETGTSLLDETTTELLDGSTEEELGATLLEDSATELLDGSDEEDPGATLLEDSVTELLDGATEEELKTIPALELESNGSTEALESKAPLLDDPPISALEVSAGASAELEDGSVAEPIFPAQAASPLQASIAALNWSS